MYSPLSSRFVLRFLCRHVAHWRRAVWRLHLATRARTHRFAGSTLVCPTRWGYTYEAPANDPIGNGLYFFGTYQPDLANCLRLLIRPGWNIVDAGANIGVLTVLLAGYAGPSGSVLALEPGSRAYGFLTRNIDRAGFSDRVSAHNIALGAADGVARFKVADDSQDVNLGGARIVSNDHNTGLETVVVRSLDSIWEERGRPHYDFIKLDIEGSELAALTGAQRLFAESPPQAVVVEFNSGIMSRNEGLADALWAFFASRDYVASDIKGRTLDQPPAKMADVLFQSRFSSSMMGPRPADHSSRPQTADSKTGRLKVAGYRLQVAGA